MWKTVPAAVLAALVLPSVWMPARAASPALTPLEARWVQAASPVVQFARAQRLPLDIVVQPDARPGDAPIALGQAESRCKLVLTMRGNPAADEALAGAAPELHEVLIEAMAAHEIGHCLRHVQGHWFKLPAGFSDGGAAIADPQLRQRWCEMQATRREEAYADLVGLAWTLREHPQQYAAVQAWFVAYRADQPVPGSYHDTRHWIGLAQQPAALGEVADPFESAHRLWLRGLQTDRDGEAMRDGAAPSPEIAR